MARLRTLRKKEVINLEDGRRIGYIHDADVDLQDGSIKALIVRVRASYMMGEGKNRELIIPFNRVVHSGGDVVIVRAEVQNILRFLEAPRP